MSKTSRFILAASILASVALAATVAAAPEKYSETLDVLSVEVPVQVLLDGEPVRGLTAENFKVFDGRKRQQIVSFEAIDLTEEETRSPETLRQTPVTARRHFLLLFDLSFADPTSIARARTAAMDMVTSEFHPSDLVAVATYTVERGPELILGFTPDRRQVELAVETLGLPDLIERATDPLAFMIAEPGFGDAEAGATDATSRGPGGRLGETEFLAQAEDYKIGFDRAQRGEEQGRVLALTTAFEDLARAMDDVSGRKHVVLLSEGFNPDVYQGTGDNRRRQEMSNQAAMGETFRIDSEERYGSTGVMTALESMLEEFRRADCAIQAVDIGGLRAGGNTQSGRANQDSLFLLANETGGELIRNFNDLGAAMEEVLERTSVTYVLTFQPEDIELDGSYHRLRIELEGLPRGARAVHRPGYYAPKPFGEKSPIERRLEAAGQIMSGRDSGALRGSVVAAAFEGVGDRAYVPLLIEIDGPSLLAGLDDDTAMLEIYTYAIAADGTIGDFLSQTMGLEVSKVRPALEAKGLKFFGDLEVPPGEYTLRVLVRDARNGRSVTRTLPLTVPELGSGQLALAPPLFPETSNDWLVVQEAEGAEERQARPFPFKLRGNPYLPSARPVIPADGPSQFVLMAYNLGTGGIPLTTQFITPEGERVEGPSVSFVERESADHPGTTQLILALDPNGIPPGEYRMVTSLKGEGGSDDATASIPFVVEGS